MEMLRIHCHPVPASPAAGIDVAALSASIAEMRGTKKVTSESAESTFDALSKYGEDLVARAEAGRIDPVIGEWRSLTLGRRRGQLPSPLLPFD